MTESNSATVLIVDDEGDVLEVFRRWLEEDYDVYTANNGNEALELLESNGIDVVLLDRRMPGISGDEVLERINELDMDCKVAMVTAVEPDLDIIAMGFDSYVVKPPTYEGLHNTIENLLARREHSDLRQEYWSLLSKRHTLREEMSTAELEDNDEYAELEDRIDALAKALGEGHDRMAEDTEFISAMRDIEGG